MRVRLTKEGHILVLGIALWGFLILLGLHAYRLETALLG